MTLTRWFGSVEKCWNQYCDNLLLLWGLFLFSNQAADAQLLIVSVDGSSGRIMQR